MKENQNILQYIILPLVFLTVAFLGGWRFALADNAFIFLRPELICLILASILIILFFRAKLINFDGWFSNDFSSLKNISHGLILTTLFLASTQIFNAVLPEKGLPFWVVSFCFFWTLCNNLFVEFKTEKLLQSLGVLFGIAFVLKYLILTNLVAPASDSWWQIIQNPTQQAFTWLLDLPRFSALTGYLQFFTLLLYLIGLFLIKPQIVENKMVNKLTHKKITELEKQNAKDLEIIEGELVEEKIEK